MNASTRTSSNCMARNTDKSSPSWSSSASSTTGNACSGAATSSRKPLLSTANVRAATQPGRTSFGRSWSAKNSKVIRHSSSHPCQAVPTHEDDKGIVAGWQDNVDRDQGQNEGGFQGFGRGAAARKQEGTQENWFGFRYSRQEENNYVWLHGRLRHFLINFIVSKS